MLSISGFVFCILYLPIEKYFYKFMSPNFMIFINLLALLTFVVPFYLFSSIYDESGVNFVRYRTMMSVGQGIMSLVMMIRYDVIWLVGAMLVLFVNIFDYIRLLKKVKCSSFYLDGSVWFAEVEKLKRENYLNKRIHVVGNPELCEPCVLGIKEYYIIIPAHLINILSCEEIDLILRHEFFHIKRRDVLLKLLILVFNCLNWFNPVFYFLRKNLTAWIEISCDCDVSSGFDEKKKILYMNLLVKTLELGKEVRNWKRYLVCFGSSDLKYYKRRITYMLNGNREKKVIRTITLTGFAVFSLFVSNVVAKELDYPINQVFSNKAEIINEEDTEIALLTAMPDEDLLKVNGPYNISLENELVLEGDKDVVYEVYFSNGTSFSCYEQETISPKHLHSFEDTIVKKHQKFSDGSCETTYYEGKCCTICEKILVGDVIKTVIESSCNH